MCATVCVGLGVTLQKEARLVPVVVLECGDVKLEQSYDSHSQSHLSLPPMPLKPLLTSKLFTFQPLAC